MSPHLAHLSLLRPEDTHYICDNVKFCLATTVAKVCKEQTTIQQETLASVYKLLELQWLAILNLAIFHKS